MKIEFEKRRKQIMKMVGSNAAIIIPCAMPCIRSRDVDYLFRQDSDFYYLSGFEEPNSLIVLIPERAEGEFILFCKNKDKLKEKWDGPIGWNYQPLLIMLSGRNYTNHLDISKIMSSIITLLKLNRHINFSRRWSIFQF